MYLSLRGAEGSPRSGVRNDGKQNRGEPGYEESDFDSVSIVCWRHSDSVCPT